MMGICGNCKYYHEDDAYNKSGFCWNRRSIGQMIRAWDTCNEFKPKEENKTMNKKKTEEKLKNLEGMKGGIEAIVAQAWERGYKYGLFEAEQKNQVKVLIGGEQVYPNAKETDND